MKSPIPMRSIDTSLLLFVVLLACAAGGVFCVIHFGNAREFARACLSLRERPRERQLQALAILFPEDTTEPAAAPTISRPVEAVTRMAAPQRPNPRRSPARPSDGLAAPAAIYLPRFPLPNDRQDALLPATTALFTPAAASPADFPGRDEL